MESYLFYLTGFIVLSGIAGFFMFRGDRQRITDIGHKLGFKVFKGASQFHHEIAGLDQNIINPRSPDTFFYKEIDGSKFSAFHLYHFRGVTTFCAVIEPAGGPWPEFQIRCSKDGLLMPEIAEFSGSDEGLMARLLASPVRDFMTQHQESENSRTLISKDGKFYYIRKSEYALLKHFLEEVNIIGLTLGQN